MKGIGGVRSSGYGPNRVGSLPDGVAHVLGEYPDDTRGENEAPLVSPPEKGNGLKSEDDAPPPVIDLQKIGDICPECGQASMINEEGCRKCYSCGYSEC